MAVSLPPWVFQQYRDDDGNPLAGGKVYFYIAGSDTPQAAYTDATGSQATENPLVLDSGGYGTFWLTKGLAYKIILENSDGTWDKTIDSILVPSDDAASGYVVPIGFEVLDADPPETDQVLGGYVFTEATSFPANFSGSRGKVLSSGDNPAASFVAVIKKNGSNVGTMTISTAGAFSFTSSGGAAQSFAAGDALEIFAPTATDSALNQFAFTFYGEVSA